MEVSFLGVASLFPFEQLLVGVDDLLDIEARVEEYVYPVVGVAFEVYSHSVRSDNGEEENVVEYSGCETGFDFDLAFVVGENLWKRFHLLVGLCHTEWVCGFPLLDLIPLVHLQVHQMD